MSPEAPKSSKMLYIAAVIAIIILAGFTYFFKSGQKTASAPNPPAAGSPPDMASLAVPVGAPKGAPTSGNLSVVTMQILNEGTGAVAEKGKTVTVHYTGWLENGAKFDSSVDRAQPFSFTLGAGQVIEGWDSGVAGMKVGEKRKLHIPPEFGYGPDGIKDPTGKPVIPPNATLIFEVELLDVK